MTRRRVARSDLDVRRRTAPRQRAATSEPDLQAVAGNRAVVAALATASPPVVQRAPGGGAPTGAAPLNSRWKKIASRLDQGSDPAEGKPIVISDVTTAEIDALDLASMVLLESHVDTKIAALSPRSSESQVYEMWLRQARGFRSDILKPATGRRRDGVIASELFWLVTDAAIAKMSPKHAAMLARVAPILWKLVDSAWSEQLDPKDKVRGGYLTAAHVSRIVGPGKKYFGPTALAGHMYNGAHELSQKFVLRGGADRPAKAVSRLVSHIEYIDEAFEAALTQLYRETGEVVFGPPKALRAALAEEAARESRSILSLMGIENRTAAEDSATEIGAAMNEIAIMSGVRGGSSRVVEVEWKGKWYAAQVLTTRADGYRYVHFIGYSADSDGWYPPSSLRTRTELAAGGRAWVRWDGASYPVTILEVGTDENAGRIRVHWLGFGTANDTNWIKASGVTGLGP